MATAIQKYSKHLNATNLINKISESFDKIKVHRRNKCPFPFANFPKSAFAMMHQQRGSHLEFDNKRNDPIQRHNLEKMYHVKDGKIPSDTRMCEVMHPWRAWYYENAFCGNGAGRLHQMYDSLDYFLLIVSNIAVSTLSDI